MARRGRCCLPLTALQILWINFLGDGPTALALAMDRCRGTMLRAPALAIDRCSTATTLRFVLLDGFIKGALGLGLLVLMPRLGSSLAATATCVFLYESVAKLLSAYPARKLGAQPGAQPVAAWFGADWRRARPGVRLVRARARCPRSRAAFCA